MNLSPGAVQLRSLKVSLNNWQKNKRQPTIGSSTADFSPATITITIISRFSQGIEYRYNGKYASGRYNPCG